MQPVDNDYVFKELKQLNDSKSIDFIIDGISPQLIKDGTDIFYYFLFLYRLASPSLLEFFYRYIGFGLMLQCPFLFNISIKHAITLF